MFSDEDDKIETYIDINNVFCSFNLQCPLDLMDIMNRSINVEMKKNREYVRMQLKNPKADARIFKTGRVTCLGTKSEEDAKKASKRFARILQKLGYDVKFSKFKISNIHGSVKLPFPVKIVEFAKAHPEASYEPELHTGVIYKVPQFKATLTIHRRGHIIILAPSQEKILQAVEHTYPLIEPFQNLKKKTKEEKLREGKYQNLVFRRFSDVISFSVFYNHRGWHCSVCKHVAKKGSKLKKHYLQKHRFEKKIFV